MKVFYSTSSNAKDLMELTAYLERNNKIEIQIAKTEDDMAKVQKGEYAVLLSDRSTRIYRSEFIELFDEAINVHPAMLPSHKGSHPLFWTCVLGDCLGISLHQIEAEIDTGNVLIRKKVEYSDEDTFRVIYNRCRVVTKIILSEFFAFKQSKIAFNSDPYVCSRVEKFNTRYWHKRKSAEQLVKKLPLGWDTPVGCAKNVLEKEILLYTS
jgi:methionyl-tRNA formyltransferase